MHFKNKHHLNEEVFPLPCPPYILDMYILVSNKPIPSTTLKLPSGPQITPTGTGIGIGVGLARVSLIMEDSNIVTPRYSWLASQYIYASAEQF
jgi:hypothetical protein